MSHDRRNQQVVHQELALDVYLSTLLDELPADQETAYRMPDEQEQRSASDWQEPEVKLQEKTPGMLESASIGPEISRGQLQVIASALETKQQPLAVMPEWAQHDFQALFFKVDQLILAAPLTELMRTIKIVRKPTKIPGQPAWFMGLLDEHENRIGVLDTGRLVLGKSRGGQRDLELNPFKSILITGDGRWGLACDEILSISRLTPEKVRWRTMREKRPWLIGTVIEELIAVIDIRQLVPHRKQR